MRFLLVHALVLLTATGASAQGLPSGPVTAFGGRVTVSGDLLATAGTDDDHAYFNFTDYEHNALHRLRLALSARWQPAAWVALLGEVASENLEHVDVLAAFVRVRPWRHHAFDLQAGMIPPVFGAFGRRAYALDNPLIGYPLAYQYLTSLRADALPARPDDLLRMRARGWRSSFPVGSGEPGPGLPLANGFRFDTGVQARWRTRAVEASVAVTRGTLSNPRVSDDNGGKQVSGRFAWMPLVGLVLGASGARGEWVSDDVPIAGPSQPDQRVLGADAEYSRGHWLIRGEYVRSRWEIPFQGPDSAPPAVTATGTWVEGRYRFTPRLFGAARLDRLTFSKVQDTLFAGAATPWDAPVTRLEATGGLYLTRRLVTRLTVQGNWRDGGRVRERPYVAVQVSTWF